MGYEGWQELQEEKKKELSEGETQLAVREESTEVIFEQEIASSQEFSKLSEEETKDLRMGRKQKELFAV